MLEAARISLNRRQSQIAIGCACALQKNGPLSGNSIKRIQHEHTLKHTLSHTHTHTHTLKHTHAQANQS